MQVNFNNLLIKKQAKITVYLTIMGAYITSDKMLQCIIMKQTFGFETK